MTDKKEYFYMFSSGSYSDYCVGGMYKSTEQRSEVCFAKYLKAKLIEQLPEARELVLTFPDDLMALSGWSVFSKLYIHCTQDVEPEYPYNTPSSSVEYANWSSKHYDWSIRRQDWKKEKGICLDIASILVKDGILEEIEYEEIHSGD